MKLKKYNSIENTYQKKVIEQIFLHEFHEDTFMVQEKVHGANLSFVTNGKEVLVAKRSGLIEANERFYNYEFVKNKYERAIIQLFDFMKKAHSNLEVITVFGEIFGGQYNHTEVEKNNGMTKVQKGIDYTPENDFYAFDILLNMETYLSVNTCERLFEKFGFFYAKTLFEGTLHEALKYPNKFRTKIPEWMGLPEIEDNNCEGVVIRPEQPRFFGNGCRVILKNKNEKWKEKVKKEKQAKVNSKLSETAENIWLEMETYITENRLHNVLSKEGEFTPKMMGKTIGLLAKDAYTDFLKEHEENWNLLEKEEQKRLTKMLNNKAVRLIKHIFMGL